MLAGVFIASSLLSVALTGWTVAWSITMEIIIRWVSELILYLRNITQTCSWLIHRSCIPLEVISVMTFLLKCFKLCEIHRGLAATLLSYLILGVSATTQP